MARWIDMTDAQKSCLDCIATAERRSHAASYLATLLRDAEARLARVREEFAR